MTETELSQPYGWAEIDPARSVTAGETSTWKITYHAGAMALMTAG